jgi:hypothetical protein
VPLCGRVLCGIFVETPVWNGIVCTWCGWSTVGIFVCVCVCENSLRGHRVGLRCTFVSSEWGLTCGGC